MHEALTKKEFIEILLTILGIVIAISSFIFGIIIKIIIDKAKIISSEDKEKLACDTNKKIDDFDKEIKKIKDNYLERFDEIKEQLHDIRLLIEHRFSDLNVQIEVLKKERSKA